MRRRNEPVSEMGSPDEAERILSARLAEMTSLPYAELARYRDHQMGIEVLGADDVKYYHETDVFDDDKPGGLLRVHVEVYRLDRATNEWSRKLAGGGALVSPAGEPPDGWRETQEVALALKAMR